MSRTFHIRWESGTNAERLAANTALLQVPYVWFESDTGNVFKWDGSDWAQFGGAGDGTAYPWRGAWVTATSYSVNDCVENDGSGYVCTQGHTSSATDEPGVGASWTTYWDLLVEGSGTFVDLTDTPSSFSGEGGEYVRVNSGETALEFHPLVVNSVTRTVGSGKDHTTIQDAIDWFQGKLITGSCKISVDAGTYSEVLIFDDLFIGKDGGLEIEGDTRALAGLSYVDGADCNPASLTNGGDGVVTLSSSGNDITVTMATTNPDFGADGWGNGDKLLVLDNDGTITEETISSVANNVITLSGAAPSVSDDATSLCLMPDRYISSAIPLWITETEGLVFDGLTLAGGTYCALVTRGSCTLQNIVVWYSGTGYLGISSFYGSWIKASSGAISAWNCSTAFSAQYAGAEFGYCVAVKPTSVGFYSAHNGSVSAGASIAVESGTAGYYAAYDGYLAAAQATARQNTTGYYAINRGYIQADNVDANNNGNSTDYNPAPTPPGSAQGNHYAVIYAS